MLAYVLQRSPDAEPNLVYPNYREIFLDDSGAYMRNVFDDFSTIPDFNPVNPEIVSIVFSVNEHGEAVIDDIQIGQTIYPDTDSDGVADVVDNCVSMPNSGQQDSDSDGYGNACDADLDNTGGVVNFSDLALFKSAFGTSNPDADFDGSGGVVNFADLAIFKQLFGKAPGPSCCGTLSP